MASLTVDSKGRSPYWICCYTSASGKRLKKSTKIRVKPLADEKHSNGSKKTQADKRAEAWEACLGYERAEDQARDGTLTEQQAKKIIGEILERTTGSALPSFTTRQWFAHWIELKQPIRSAKTMDRYRQVVRDFLASLGTRADLQLAHITSRDLLAYRQSITKAGKTGRTANLSMKVVGAAFNAAKRQQHIAMNPCEAVESLAVKAEPKIPFTRDQVARLAKATPDEDWRGAILFGYYTGARLSDTANMQALAIDFDRNIAQFTASKTGKLVTVPLHKELRQELLGRPKVGKAFLFPTLAGKPTGGRNGLSGRFAAIVKAAGIEPKVTKTTDGSGRSLANLTFHSLRHSFNSEMANAGISQEVRQKLTGHTSAESNALYTHHQLQPLQAAVAAIPSLSM